VAGMKPFFLTGANAKIRVNGATLAYCTNLSYSVTVSHSTPTVLGMYEPSSVEPTGYLVSGTFTIIRYVADVKDELGKTPNDTSNTGNGIGNWGVKKSSKIIDLSGSDGKVYDNLNPGKLERATGFEIEIFQKTENKNISVAKIRGARITKADFMLAKNSPAAQTFQFTALYADEDSFLADFSGRGQQFV